MASRLLVCDIIFLFFRGEKDVKIVKNWKMKRHWCIQQTVLIKKDLRNYLLIYSKVTLKLEFSFFFFLSIMGLLCWDFILLVNQQILEISKEFIFENIFLELKSFQAFQSTWALRKFTLCIENEIDQNMNVCILEYKS